MSKVVQLYGIGYLPIATRMREALVRKTNGQTMTEYALILAGVAVVAYAAYAAMGKNIGSLASGVDSSLTSV